MTNNPLLRLFHVPVCKNYNRTLHTLQTCTLMRRITFDEPRYFYRPKTKFGEGNVYRHLSVWGWGVGTSHTSWDRPHVRVPPPLPSRHQTWGPTPFFPWTSDLLGTYPLPATDIWWLSLRPVQICSIEDPLHCSPPPPRTHWYWYLVVATETRTVGKRVVRILLG